MRGGLCRDVGHALARQVERRNARVEERSDRDGDPSATDLDQVVRHTASEVGDVRERPVVDLVRGRPGVVLERDGATRSERAGVEVDCEAGACGGDPAVRAGGEDCDAEVAAVDRQDARDRDREPGELDRQERAVEVRARLGRDTGHALANHVERGDARREQRAERDGDIRPADLDQVISEAAPEPGDVRERPVVDLVAGGAAVVREADRAARAQWTGVQVEGEARPGRGDPAVRSRLEGRDRQVAAVDREGTRDVQRHVCQLDRQQRAVEVRSGLGRDAGDGLADHVEGANGRVEDGAECDVDARTADLDEVIGGGREPGDVGERPVVDLPADRAGVVGEGQVAAVGVQRTGGQRQTEGVAVRPDPGRGAGGDDGDPEVAVAQADRATGHRDRETADLEREQGGAGRDRSSFRRHGRAQGLSDHVEARDCRGEQRPQRDVDTGAADLDEIISGSGQTGDVGERPVVDLTADRPRVVGERQVRPVRMQRPGRQRQPERVAVRPDPGRSARGDHGDPEIAVAQADRAARDAQV